MKNLASRGVEDGGVFVGRWPGPERRQRSKSPTVFPRGRANSRAPSWSSSGDGSGFVYIQGLGRNPGQPPQSLGGGERAIPLPGHTAAVVACGSAVIGGGGTFSKLDCRDPVIAR